MHLDVSKELCSTLSRQVGGCDVSQPSFILYCDRLRFSSKHLQDAMVVTAMRKDSRKAEHARCVFKLSEMLQQEPSEEEETAMLQHETEHLLRQLSLETKEPD